MTDTNRSVSPLLSFKRTVPNPAVTTDPAPSHASQSPTALSRQADTDVSTIVSTVVVPKSDDSPSDNSSSGRNSSSDPTTAQPPISHAHSAPVVGPGSSIPPHIEDCAGGQDGDSSSISSGRDAGAEALLNLSTAPNTTEAPVRLTAAAIAAALQVQKACRLWQTGKPVKAVQLLTSSIRQYPNDRVGLVALQRLLYEHPELTFDVVKSEHPEQQDQALAAYLPDQLQTRAQHLAENTDVDVLHQAYTTFLSGPIDALAAEDTLLAVLAVYSHLTLSLRADLSRRLALLAHAGDVLAQSLLGTCYFHGTGVRPDQVKASDMFERAQQAGNLHARFNRAVCAYNGAGMDKDLLLARTLFTRAAAAGHPAAMTNLALCLYRGEGGGRDPSQAVALLRKACSFGLPQAQYQLGLLYFRSKQAKVRTEGTALLQRAAAQGFAGAHATLQQLAASKSRQGNSRAVPSHPTGTVRTANTNSNDGSMDSESSDSGSNPSTDKGTSKRLAQTSRDSSDNNADKAAPPTKRPHRTSPSPSTSTANPLVPRSFPAGYSLGPFRGAPAGFGFPAGFPLMHNAVGGSYPPAAQAPQPKQAAFAKQLQQQLASAGVLVDGLVPSIPALHQCVLLSSSGDTNSMFIVAVLALCLRCGLSDMTMGAELSRRAGEAGHPAAAWVYSLCLREGMGVEANVRLAETYASLAVSAGFLPPAGMT